MKKTILFSVILSAVIAVTGCKKSEEDSEVSITNNDICLILDGTDRLSLQNDVPTVPEMEIVDMAQTLIEMGTGNIYVCYVDDDCSNNDIAIFTWEQVPPAAVGDKLGYETMEAYNAKKAKYDSDMGRYAEERQEAISAFSDQCRVVTELAYSDRVANQKKGSDTNGAINRAVHLLKTSQRSVGKSYIILVSDGCDNVGNELNEVPDDIELLLVNPSVAKHNYQSLVTREFATLQQALRYIF